MSSEEFLQPYSDIARLLRRAREILGIPPDAGVDEVRSAFRRLAREQHPDRGGSHEDFVRVVNAYLALTRSDPRGLCLEEGDSGKPAEASRTHESYLEWWLDRFFS